MSELEVLSPPQKEEQVAPDSSNLVLPRCCPVCNIQTSYVYKIAEGDSGISASWYRCQCGVVFQENLPAHDGYNDVYAARYFDMKEGAGRIIHSARTYVNLIEELTYGRMMLDVGFCVLKVMDFFDKRGWLTWGIDVNRDINYGGNLYQGNYETYDFSIPAKNKDLEALFDGKSKERTYDLIWMNHVFEHFNDPISVLKKTYNLLSETGVVFIAVPDMEFINKTGVSGFPHFKSKEHYVLWSKGALCRELERAGFNVIMARRNYSSRFSSWYDIHVIAQKNYF